MNLTTSTSCRTRRLSGWSKFSKIIYGYFFHFLSALMVSGESCNGVNYKTRSIGAETRLGSDA